MKTVLLAFLVAGMSGCAVYPVPLFGAVDYGQATSPYGYAVEQPVVIQGGAYSVYPAYPYYPPLLVPEPRYPRYQRWHSPAYPQPGRGNPPAYPQTYPRPRPGFLPTPSLVPVPVPAPAPNGQLGRDNRDRNGIPNRTENNQNGERGSGQPDRQPAEPSLR